MNRVALKIQYWRHARDAVSEISVHHRLRRAGHVSDGLIELIEAFQFRERIGMVFPLFGRSLDAVLDQGPLELPDIKHLTRQLLDAVQTLHAAGMTHADIKPGNILLNASARSAKLIDLGGVVECFEPGDWLGTRDYRAPEVILGAPLGPALDLWSCGCTVWRMLTRMNLFDPWESAARKYIEFSPPSEDAANAEDELSPADRDAAGRGIETQVGQVWAGKYRLEEKLGEGGFGEVWSATVVSDAVLDGTYATLWAHAQKIEAAKPALNESERQDRAWRREKGADDLHDLVLNYEQLLLMQQACGVIPPAVVEAGVYRRSYFQENGTMRFDSAIEPLPWLEKLRLLHPLTAEEAETLHDFLCGLWQPDPARRRRAEECLRHPWLRE